MPGSNVYRAFLSYSHQADAALGRSIQRGLHRFAKPFYRMRALRIFRDQTDLSVTPSLWPSIEHALAESDYLLLMASATAAQSKWVKKEIAFWIEHKPIDHLLLLLTGGDLAWDDRQGDFDWSRSTAVPEILGGRFAQEPLFVDFRNLHDPSLQVLRSPEFRDAIATVAATLHGKGKSELESLDGKGGDP
jgi:hypothetical protein